MKAFRTVLDEHANPTHASKVDAHRVLAQVLPMIAASKKQTVEYHSIIDAAELVDDRFGPKAEYLRQILGGIEREDATIAAAARAKIKAHAQFDEQMQELQRHVEKAEADGAKQ